MSERRLRKAIQELVNDFDAECEGWGVVARLGDARATTRRDTLQEASRRVEALLGGRAWDDLDGDE